MKKKTFFNGFFPTAFFDSIYIFVYKSKIISRKSNANNCKEPSATSTERMFFMEKLNSFTVFLCKRNGLWIPLQQSFIRQKKITVFYSHGRWINFDGLWHTKKTCRYYFKRPQVYQFQNKRGWDRNPAPVYKFNILDKTIITNCVLILFQGWKYIGKGINSTHFALLYK